MPTPPPKKRKNQPHRAPAPVPDTTPDATPTPTPPQDLPDPDTVIAEVPFTSPKGHTYRIIVTNQTDAYDPPLVAEGSKQKAVRRKRRKK